MFFITFKTCLIVQENIVLSKCFSLGNMIFWPQMSYYQGFYVTCHFVLKEKEKDDFSSCSANVIKGPFFLDFVEWVYPIQVST